MSIDDHFTPEQLRRLAERSMRRGDQLRRNRRIVGLSGIPVLALVVLASSLAFGGKDSTESNHLKAAGRDKNPQPSATTLPRGTQSPGQSPGLTPPLTPSKAGKSSAPLGSPRLDSPGTPAAASNGLIAYASGGIYVMRPDGSGKRRLSATGAFPVWSPDGRRLAFIDDGPDTNLTGPIFTVGVDGAGRRQVADSTDTPPTWSPDGALIAYTSRTSSTTVDLWVVAADGSNPKRLTSGASARRASWSPDGKRLSFSNGGQLTVMDSDGSHSSVIGAWDHQVDQVLWSPSGEFISYSALPLLSGDTKSYLYVIRPDGSGMKNLGLLRGWPQVWSRDGTKILFFGDWTLTIIRPDGSERRTLPSTASDNPADWSPDGRQIVYTRFQEVWVMSVDGTNQNLVARGSSDTSHPPAPVWSPS